MIQLPKGITKILFKTDNSDLLNKHENLFREDYVALTDKAAKYLVKKGIDLVGIDYLSIALFKETRPVHETLLSADVGVVEGLNLRGVSEGEYELFVLPLLVPGKEASPARAILIER